VSLELCGRTVELKLEVGGVDVEEGSRNGSMLVVMDRALSVHFHEVRCVGVLHLG